ncbi:unnamed protein product [Ectocarpus sp. 12 AP-2014]
MFQKQSLTMAVAGLWCSLPSPSLAFPIGAALSAASVSGTTVPFSGMMTRKGCFRRRLPQQQQQQQQQHGRSGYSSLTLKPRANERVRPISMALPTSRRASIAIFTAGMLFGCCISSPVSANIRLYRTVPDIPKSMFKNHATLNGNVVTVSDGDSIRVRHKPNIPLPLPNRDMTGKKNSEETLQIRLYAVDCPEVAHFGNPAQPFSAEAKAFTKEALQGKPVKIKLLSMDQYNRAVCRVQYGKWPFRKDISAELLKNGLGVVYRQGGAEYDGREESLTECENSAKSRKEGVWSRSNGETPAQYKARIKQQQPAAS